MKKEPRLLPVTETEYGLECVTGYYPIEAERLGEDDWVDHMAEKDWVNIRDFVRALRAARKHFRKTD